MSMFKKILQTNSAKTFLCFLTFLYIKFVYATSKWEYEGYENVEKYFKEKKPFILAFWHGRLLMMPKSVPKKSIVNVIISNHRDGELIARVMQFFKFKLIRGSTSKGGMLVVKNAMCSLNKNEIIAITPDGPRGPRMRYQGGMIALAIKTKVPIIPVTYSASKVKILNSWDRFLLALPFSKGMFIYGEPIIFKQEYKDADIEKAGMLFEKQLNLLTKKADNYAKIENINPE